jgi:hypothetical protein
MFPIEESDAKAPQSSEQTLPPFRSSIQSVSKEEKCPLSGLARSVRALLL